MSAFYLGIDGGGTSCRAAVADAQGRILGRATSGSANILSDFDGAHANILAAATGALSAAALPTARLVDCTAVLGLAGNNVGDTAARMAARLPFAETRIVSDGLIALEGAFGRADGAILIVGTGTIGIVRAGGQVSTLGGWGFQVSDLGSGARLGQAALQESLLAYDGIGPRSPFTDAVLALFDRDPDQIVLFARSASPGDYARHARLVLEHAERGDPVAMAILAASLERIDAMAEAAFARGAPALCLLGGLGPVLAPKLAARHQARIVPPEADAVSGAVALAVAHGRTKREAAE